MPRAVNEAEEKVELPSSLLPGCLHLTWLLCLIAGMMEFSLFGIPYVSQIGTVAPCPDFSVCVSVLEEYPVDILILLLLRQEQTSVGSLEMLSMRCVSGGCNWEHFIHFPGTTTMQEVG